ncbi:hypothetical protein ACIBEJ_00840 [Nonomuraea sp. NPDC050790]|uniref:hypothetical protein n=1 Tax=Nonomuraea sp. NPDC050790 TaxID=3364371 RepID=UPI0037A97770
MTATILGFPACNAISTVPVNMTVRAERIQPGDIVAIPGEPTVPGGEYDSFAARVAGVVAEEGGRYVVHTYYTDDSSYYRHTMTDADRLYMLRAARA